MNRTHLESMHLKDNDAVENERVDQSVSDEPGQRAYPPAAPGEPDSFEVEPYHLRNSTRAVAHLEIRSLAFSSVKGIALLPGQTLEVLHRLDVTAIERQVASSR